MILNAILSGGSFMDILQAVVFGTVAVLLSISIHEFAHAFTAYKMGDYSQKSYGRMTLNPFKHVNPLGMIIFLILGFGWANPVIMDSRNFKHPKLGIILTSLAGAFANFLSAFIWLLIFGIINNLLTSGAVADNVSTLLIYLISFNLAFGFFNLIPIPPLDGSKVVAEVLPFKWKYKYLQLERYSIYIFFALIIILNRFNFISMLSNWLMTVFARLIDPILQLIFG